MIKPYPSYKYSGVEWIRGIPNEWKKKSLKFSLKITKGKIPKKIFYKPNKKLLPYLSMDMLRNGNIQKYCTKLDGIAVEKGDLLILWDGENSGEILIGIKGILSSTMCKMDLVGHDLERNFIYYLLKFYEKDFQNNTIGMGIPHMDGDYLRSSKLIVPPLLEQKQIALFLDAKTRKINDLLKKSALKIELLKEKRVALINHCVTKGLNSNVKMKDSGVKWIGDIPEHWNIIKLKFISKCNENNLSETTEPNFSFKYVEIGNVSFGKLKDKLENYRFSNAPTRARRIVSIGDILVSTVRTYLKAIIQFPNASENIIASTGFAIITAVHIYSRFLYFFALSAYFISEVVSRSVGVSYPAINTSELISIPILVPPPDEQVQIAKYIDTKTKKIDASIKKEAKRIELLKEYRQSLISEVVTGKIDVRDWKG